MSACILQIVNSISIKQVLEPIIYQGFLWLVYTAANLLPHWLAL